MTLFAPASIWNTDIRSAPLDANSAPIVAQLLTHTGRNINTTHYAMPIYTVPATQPTRRVHITRQPNAHVSAEDIAAMQALCEHVPVPANAAGSLGADGALSVRCGNEVWDFGFYKGGASPSAWSMGYIPDITTHSGVYSAASKMGSTAPGFASQGGLITLADLAGGSIPHALSMACPARAGWRALPANRTDGKDTTQFSMPEGAHLRIDPNLDLSKLAMPQFTRWLAEAAQQHGIIINNQSSSVVFVCEDPTHLGGLNPYTKPGGYFGGQGVPALLRAFPWAHLQVTQMDLQPWP